MAFNWFISLAKLFPSINFSLSHLKYFMRLTVHKISKLVCFAAPLNTRQAYDLRQSGRAATIFLQRCWQSGQGEFWRSRRCCAHFRPPAKLLPLSLKSLYDCLILTPPLILNPSPTPNPKPTNTRGVIIWQGSELGTTPAAVWTHSKQLRSWTLSDKMKMPSKLF